MEPVSETICQITGARSVELGETIQTLWSGYGIIQRATLFGTDLQHVVVKHIDISQTRSNRRGWGSDVSHQRKVQSYRVETSFYDSYASQCDKTCRVPEFIAAHEKDDNGGWILVLQDLDVAGFSERRQHAHTNDVRACLAWLANFHAKFLGNDALGLWEVGTYWHLATRPEELSSMPEGALKQAAAAIDQRLNAARFQTLVHGDAKLANFCFAADSDRVAAVDFQYVGRGCGMKDVAYFISSCLSDDEAFAQQEDLLAYYFAQLSDSLSKSAAHVDFAALESEWRLLYPFAWADFCRFLSGWSPGHWKLNRYTDQLTESVIRKLGET